MKRKIIYLIALFFIGIGIVSAATGGKPVFSRVDGYLDGKIKYLYGFDKKGDIEAYVGTPTNGNFGLYVYQNNALKFQYIRSGDLNYSNVTILDDYIIAYGTSGGYFTFTSDDIIVFFDIFDMNGNIIDSASFLGNTEDLYGRIIDGGNNMFVIWEFSDMGYFPNVPEGQNRRVMYHIGKVTADGYEMVADETVTEFDQLLMDNVNQMPYVEAIDFKDNYRAIVGDSRLFGGDTVRYLRLYDGRDLVFETTEGLTYSDDTSVRDVAILDDYVIVLVDYNGRKTIYEYTMDGELLVGESVEDGAYRVAGSENTFMYGVGTGYGVRKHYSLDFSQTGPGEVQYSIVDYPAANNNVLKYINAGDEIEVVLTPAEGNVLKKITLNGEELECDDEDDEIICSFLMPQDDSEVEIIFGEEVTDPDTDTDSEPDDPKPQTKEYKILEGANQVYSGEKNIIIKSEGAFSNFESLKIDGKELVKDKDYSVKDGSTVLEIYTKYLDGLKNGEHEVLINFSDGYVSSTKLTVSINPNTVDIVGLAAILAVISVFLFFGVKNIKVKRYSN